MGALREIVLGKNLFFLDAHASDWEGYLTRGCLASAPFLGVIWGVHPLTDGGSGARAPLIPCLPACSCAKRKTRKCKLDNLQQANSPKNEQPSTFEHHFKLLRGSSSDVHCNFLPEFMDRKNYLGGSHIGCHQQSLDLFRPIRSGAWSFLSSMTLEK